MGLFRQVRHLEAKLISREITAKACNICTNCPLINYVHSLRLGPDKFRPWVLLLGLRLINLFLRLIFLIPVCFSHRHPNNNYFLILSFMFACPEASINQLWRSLCWGHIWRHSSPWLPIPVKKGLTMRVLRLLQSCYSRQESVNIR